MPSSILHDFPIRASAATVFAAVVSPDTWWTLESDVQAALGSTSRLYFGEGYDWRALVSACEPGVTFEWTFTDAMPDWMGTRLRFDLTEADGVTAVHFAHHGWETASEHFRVSSFCWAMYLRLLRRTVETGEVVPYARRLDA
ncbi:MAG: SRPBCC domain-containing protein [Gemmatimonadaceae bacterium]|nr:SRPBCC domain-containing protein [Gemmatimonadaceae bacterium]